MYTDIQKEAYAKNCKIPCIFPRSEKCRKCLKGNGIKVMEKPLKYNTTYRFRILNGDYDQTFE